MEIFICVVSDSVAIKDLSNINLGGTKLLKSTDWQSIHYCKSTLIFKSSCFPNSWTSCLQDEADISLGFKVSLGGSLALVS